mmetsp:Transcript_80603/g.228339  ORF Transcript_80603/g.228339 Transcript_80603/m.228339 type:complete len:239 (+) Transcript_80603:2-718(+)
MCWPAQAWSVPTLPFGSSVRAKSDCVAKTTFSQIPWPFISFTKAVMPVFTCPNLRMMFVFTLVCMSQPPRPTKKKSRSTLRCSRAPMRRATVLRSPRLPYIASGSARRSSPPSRASATRLKALTPSSSWLMYSLAKTLENSIIVRLLMIRCTFAPGWKPEVELLPETTLRRVVSPSDQAALPASEKDCTLKLPPPVASASAIRPPPPCLKFKPISQCSVCEACCMLLCENPPGQVLAP